MSAVGNTGEPRRSKRKRIDLRSEEGFDRHELERALRQSLQEERTKEKDKPVRGKRKADRAKALVRRELKRTVEEAETEKKAEERSNKVEKKVKQVRKIEKQVESASPASSESAELSSVQNYLEGAKIRKTGLARRQGTFQSSRCGVTLVENETIKVHPDTEEAVDCRNRAKTEVKIQPLTSYRIPSSASDLITLLACAREVLGDHECLSCQD